MARCPFATWDPVSAAGVPFTSPIRKVVHHKTQTTGGRTVSLYPNGGADAPHFTVDETGIRQHFDTSVGSRALENHAGGVETNSDGVIQIEICGYSGTTMPGATANNLVRVLKWIEATHHVPWVWPAGRPGTSSVRSTSAWAQAGHFGHVQVPENSHWDPDYTDLEWLVLNSAMTVVVPPVVVPTPPAPFKEYPVSSVRVHTVVMTLGSDGKGWGITPDLVPNPYMVKEQGRYSAIGAPDVYETPTLWRSFPQAGKVEVVVSGGRGNATVAFEIHELVP